MSTPTKEPQGARTPAPGKFRIHLLLQVPDGPIQSGEGGTAIKVGTRSRWVFACDPGGRAQQTLADRGTTEPYAVYCDACKATDAFKAVDRPRPLQAGGVAGDLTADGCC